MITGKVPRIMTVVALMMIIIEARAQVPDSASPSHTSSPSIGSMLWDDIRIAAGDAGSFFTAPLRFSGRDWLLTAGALGGAAGVMTADADVRDFFQRGSRRPLHSWFAPTADYYGVIRYANAFSMAVYTTGLAIRNDHIRVTGRLLFETLTLSGSLVIVMRYTFGRLRPSLTADQWDFRSLKASLSSQSFPSGHSAVAFSISTILAERIDSWWARVVFYSLAAATAVGRVYDNHHWASDVMVGSALGLSAGLHVTAREKQRSNSHQANGFSILPSHRGIILVYSLP